MLHLGRDRAGAACTQRGGFSGDRANIYAAGSAIEAYTVCGEIAHAAVVYVVVNDTGVNVVHRAVVKEVVAVPVAAIVSAAGIAEAVVNSAVETDVVTPVPAIKGVPAVRECPIRRCPERSNVGREHPGSGDPVIAAVCVVPIARGPVVVVAGAGRLRVFR
jgi:hypothetical protein